MQLGLKIKAATCKILMMMIYQRMSEIFAEHCWKQNRWFLKTHYFVMIYLRKLAEKYKTEMRL